MSISSTTSRNNYVGTASLHAYSYSFYIQDDDDLLVTVADTDGVETALTKTTDYTVSGVGAANGGTVTLVNASQAWLTSGELKTGYVITIRRVLSLKQEADIRNQGTYFPETHEDVFDHQTMVDQQQQDEIGRSVKLPETYQSGFDPTLPIGIVGAESKAPITNAAGNGWADPDDWPTATDISEAQENAEDAGDSAAAALVSQGAAAASAAAAAASAASIQPIPSGGTTGQALVKASNTNYDTHWAGVGSVTSIAMTVPSGLSVSGSPITGAGTLAITASGQFAASQMPALTGDITTSAGAVATTAAATQPNIQTLSRAAGVAVHGTNTNDSAAAGYVGEYISASQSTPTDTAATTVWADGASISLTAGDWDVTAVFKFDNNGGTVGQVFGGISATSGNSTTGLVDGDNKLTQIGCTASYASSVSIANYRVSLTATTTYYAKQMAQYSVAAPRYVCRISARRVH